MLRCSGYMPPEYILRGTITRDTIKRGIITPKTDIFSLGVIITEIITGHRDYPYDINEASSEEFINTVRKNNFVKETLFTNHLSFYITLLHSRFYVPSSQELQKWRNKLEKEPGNTNLETDSLQIEKCIQIGLMCVNPDRTKRPAIRNIINMLQGLESTTCYISS